jgi:hypothetical protein
MNAPPDPSLSFSELDQFKLDPETIRYLDRSFSEENQVVHSVMSCSDASAGSAM